MRRYLPDFIVLVDDGHGPDDLLHLVVEIKGYRREDAKEKKLTMDSYSVPGVNHLGAYGRWAFAEFTEVYQIEADFEARVESQFDELIAAAANGSLAPRQSISDRSANYLQKHFGDGHLLAISNAIWRAIDSNPDRAFHLSDIEAVATEVRCKPDDALSVLGLLASPSACFLQMELRSAEYPEEAVSSEEFIGKLREWWKKKTVSREEWERWAGTITVRWIIAKREEGER